jgi:hypothetical protein
VQGEGPMSADPCPGHNCLLTDGQPTWTKDEAVAMADRVCGALVEAGRPDLARQVLPCADTCEPGERWQVIAKRWAVIVDADSLAIELEGGGVFTAGSGVVSRYLTEDEQALIVKAGHVAGLYR